MAPKPGARRDPATGQFALRYDTFALLETTRVVLLHAAGIAGLSPLDVIQDGYDTARAPAVHPTSKRVWRVAAQLNATWEKVKEIAMLDGGSYTSAVRALEWRGRVAFENELISRALRTIALRLDVATLRPDHYRDELANLIREEKLRWLHGVGVAANFPNETQIDHQVGYCVSGACRNGRPTHRPHRAIPSRRGMSSRSQIRRSHPATVRVRGRWRLASSP